MADTLDVCILATVKLALGIEPDEQSYDVELAEKITAVSRMLDEKCGPIVQRTITAEEIDAKSGLASLKWYPVVSVTTVTEYSGTTATVLTQQSPGTAPASGYRVDKSTGMLTRYSGGTPCWFAPVVVVIYEAGRYATTATVDKRFAEAAESTVVEQWRATKGMGTVTFGVAPEGGLSGATGIPRDAWQLIKSDLRVDWLP